jgi:hypothetical protein
MSRKSPAERLCSAGLSSIITHRLHPAPRNDSLSQESERHLIAALLFC